MTLPSVTLTGNLVADVELKWTSSGIAIASMRVACSSRKKDGDQWVDGATTFVSVKAWRQLGENVAESATKGTSVTVVGDLAQDDWEDKEGNKRSSYSVTAKSVAVDLSRCTATVRKAERTAHSETGRAVDNDPWATTSAVDAPF